MFILANHNGRRHSNKPIVIQSRICAAGAERGKMCASKSSDPARVALHPKTEFLGSSPNNSEFSTLDSITL